MSRSPSGRFPARKRWGQNFLQNVTALERICDAVGAGPDDLVLEIGPGEGALTRRLLATGAAVTAIEIDPRLIHHLEKEFDGSRLVLVHDDATSASLPEDPYLAVGNLPFNVATPIIRRVISSPSCKRAVFMVQKEVAKRFVAQPGSEDYGYLTLYCGIYARPKILMTIGPGSFRPRPRVQSSVVVFDVEPASLSVPAPFFDEVVSLSFRMRRKKLLNNLAGFKGLSKEMVQQLLERSEIDPGIRAEMVSFERFDRLAAMILASASESSRPRCSTGDRGS